MIEKYKELKEKNIRKYIKIIKISKIIMIQGGVVGTIVPLINAIIFRAFGKVNYICMVYTIVSVIVGMYLSYYSAEPYRKKVMEYENLIFEESLNQIKGMF